MTSTAERPVATIARPGWLQDLIDGLRETLRARDLITQLVVRDIRVRYSETVMGFAWAVLMPTLIVLSGLIFRIAATQATGGSINRQVLLGLAVKGLAWGFFAGAIIAATVCLTGNGYLISKIYFPRAVLPLAANIAQGFDTLVASAAMALFLPWLGLVLSPALVWVPILVALLVLLTFGLSLALSCANVLFRDVKHIVQVLITFGIFFTPVFYEPTMLGAKGVRLLMYNPLSPLLQGLELTLTTGHNLLNPLLVSTPQASVVAAWLPHYLWYSTTWAIGAILLGAITFRRTESSFAELV
jgi:lipopolysaccharide transport system permease protein